MKMMRSTRKLIVTAGIAAAARGEIQPAINISAALPLLVRDDLVREQCEKMFSILLDNRRLTQPSYSPCEELHLALDENIIHPVANFKYQTV